MASEDALTAGDAVPAASAPLVYPDGDVEELTGDDPETFGFT